MNAPFPQITELTNRLEAMPIDLAQVDFFCTLVTELAQLIEETVGLKQAEGFITSVGLRMGKVIGDKYAGQAIDSVERLEALAAVLIDLKRRIMGEFYVIEIADSHILLGNTRCPFGDAVEGRKSLCMMTTNVFGRIAADTGGYARVAVLESIAAGSDKCRVLIDLSLESEPALEGTRPLHSGEFFAT
ncbi:methanogen output domain 1-containing protein [Litorivita sp. NS0012-18]|uniref:methanogen output domain 1-containing protein n=1 Tax=Litorivita sp. NS0012-18 TaxID=3127655 RepID=UPI0031057F33